MSRDFTVAAMLAVVFFACSAESSFSAVDESKEPPQQFTLKLGDKSVAVAEGQPVRVDGTFTDPKITLTAEPYRLFPYAGVSFQYPRAFTFEAELGDPDVKSWTLSGNDFKIMYFVTKARLTPGAYAQSMIDQFGEQNCKITDPKAAITLGGQNLIGKVLTVTVASHEMSIEIYSLPMQAGAKGGRLLVLQDNHDKEGGHTKEGLRTLEVLKTSLEIKP